MTVIQEAPTDGDTRDHASGAGGRDDSMIRMDLIEMLPRRLRRRGEALNGQVAVELTESLKPGSGDHGYQDAGARRDRRRQ